MAIPIYATVLSQINTYIVANGNNEITANVLNPILKLMLDFSNNNIGDLDTLTTDEKNSIVEAINSLKQNFDDLVNNGVQLYTGIDDPNVTPPPTYKYADFYMQLDIDSLPVKLWQWNGFVWTDASQEPATESDNVINNSDVDGVTVTDALNNLLDAIPAEYTKVVYVNNINPNSATIFDLNNPPTVNDNLLKTDVNNLYIGTDASTWVYNATSLTYVTKTISSNTSNFYLYGTTTDAGNSKTADIERSGKLDLKSQLIVGLARLGSFITTGRHLSQFNAGDQQTPLIVSGGHSTIEYFKNLLVPRYAWATGLQNPSSATVDYEPYNSYRIFFSDNAAYQKIFELSQQGNIYTKGVLSETIVAFTPTISGQPAIIKHVASVNTTQPVKLVIYFHGSGTPQLNPFTDANSKYVIDKLLSEGYIVATSQAHGNAWGNQASQDDYLALYNYIIAAYNISDVVFVGHSMGGITSLNMIAKNTIPAVTKWYGIYPATNLSEAYFTEGFASAIETAYGFVGGANYAAATAGNDPNLYAGSVYTGKKYTMTASPGDLTIIKTTNADLINTKFTGAGIDSYIVTASGLHGDISHFIPKHIAWFIFDKISVVNTALGMIPRLDFRNNLIASAILDDGTNINLTRNTRLTGSTPTFSLINSASSNKRWDMRVSGNNWILTESGVGNPITVNAGGLVTLTNNLVTIAGTTANHAVIKSQLDLKADLSSFASGSFTPTITNVSNTSALSVSDATYTRIGNIVTARISVSVTAGSTTASGCSFSITLPVNRASTTSVSMGDGSLQDNSSGSIVAIKTGSNTTNSTTCVFTATGLNVYTGAVVIQYSIL